MVDGVDPGAATNPVRALPPEPELEPPPRRPRTRSNANLYSLLGLAFALIAAGVYFFLFLRPAQQRALLEIARFTAVEGDVKVKPELTQAWTPAKAKMSLRAGDVVQTAPLAGAGLTFKSGNVVRLRPDSVVLIGDSGDDAASEQAWRLESGQANFESSMKTEISTKNAITTTAASSEGNISVEEGGNTGIKIFKGSAEVATVAGDKVTLRENEALKVDAKGKAGRKTVLPSAPQTVAPPAQSELAYKRAPDTTTRLEWSPVPGGASYRVAMDFNVIQADLLLSAALDQPGIPESHHDLKGLDPGKYYWRVAAVNEDGDEGKYSKVTSFAVVQRSEAPVATPAPAATRIEALEAMGAVLALRGRAAPGSTVSVDGVDIPVQRDGSFSEFLKRGGRREVTIRVTSPGGEVTVEKRPVS